MVAEPIDLEIILRRRDSERYNVEVRGTSPDDDSEVRPLAEPAIAQFNFEALLRLGQDLVAYGRALGEMLFSDARLSAAVDSARAIADSNEQPLRLRITIERAAPELHTLRWEALRDPRRPNNPLLTTGERVFFSRYLASADWQLIQPRARGDLRALVVIANPTGLEAYGLTPIDTARELEIAGAALHGIATTLLKTDQRATLDTLIQYLRQGYDIVYLMCHARQQQEETRLFLEGEQGQVAVVAGTVLATRIDELIQRPRLVVLAACQSAGTDIAAALTALGPQLAVAGIPAVLAMQGVVSVETIETLLVAFFEALQHDGQIDRALAIARGRVRDRHDFWMPVLFMRLKSGRVWYVPGFTDERPGSAEEKWEPLLVSIRDSACTPILGPDLLEGLLGSRRELARALAEDFHFPLAPHDREGLPQVAQFLFVRKKKNFLDQTVVRYLCKELRRRRGSDLPPEAQAVDLDKTPWRELLRLLDAWLRQAWEAEQARNPSEPYCVLANLPLPIYITADPSDLLIHALRKAGKEPQAMFSPWNEYTRNAPSPCAPESDYMPSPERPLVYRLFGSYQEPDSLVLTEDSHFDYLIGITQNKERIPTAVRAQLVDTALLFLGFRPDDGTFRVVFRSMMNQSGAPRLAHYAHIAVQVAPEEGRTLSPKLAQRYLEEYFTGNFTNRDAFNISIYWGRAEDFLHGLYERF